MRGEKYFYLGLYRRRVPNPLDIREDFIEELKKSGKLPLTHYDAYITACRQMEKQFPEVENMDWMESTDGKENYQRLMNEIAMCKDSRQQSFLVDKLDSVLIALLPPLDPTVVNAVEFNCEINDVKAKHAVAWKVVFLKERLGEIRSTNCNPYSGGRRLPRAGWSRSKLPFYPKIN